MSFSVNVRLGEVSASTSLSELSASVTISGGLLRSIPFSANKDTELEFADTITFSVDSPDSSNNYFWEVENENGFKTAIGQSVKQDYAGEGEFDVNLIASNTSSIEGVNFKQDFVKVDFKFKDPLLDQVPGAAAAYSIRLLRSGYSGGLLRVRAVDSNGTDQGEADVKTDGNITPDGSVTISLSSPIENLDSKAQGRGLSNSDTLGDLVDSGGANYDGFVPKWYDQSPNARHATNGTASEQPKLVSAGNLITENGKPALDFDGGDDGLIANVIINDTHSNFTLNNISGGDHVIDFDGDNNLRFVYRNDLLDYFLREQGGNNISLSISNVSGQLLLSFIGKGQGNNLEVYKNNVLDNSGTIPSGNYSTSSMTLTIGNNLNKNRGSAGKFQELISYNKDLEADRTKVQTLINDFYQIPNF